MLILFKHKEKLTSASNKFCISTMILKLENVNLCDLHLQMGCDNSLFNPTSKSTCGVGSPHNIIT